MLTPAIHAPVDLFVCVTCRASGDGSDRPGVILHGEMQRLLAGRDDVTLHATECLSVCTRPCTVAVAAPGKWSYVVAGLDAMQHASALAEYVGQYAASSDGVPSFKDRPKVIRSGTIARIPPRNS